MNECKFVYCLKSCVSPLRVRQYHKFKLTFQGILTVDGWKDNKWHSGYLGGVFIVPSDISCLCGVYLWTGGNGQQSPYCGLSDLHLEGTTLTMVMGVLWYLFFPTCWREDTFSGVRLVSGVEADWSFLRCRNGGVSLLGIPHLSSLRWRGRGLESLVFRSPSCEQTRLKALPSLVLRRMTEFDRTKGNPCANTK